MNRTLHPTALLPALYVSTIRIDGTRTRQVRTWTPRISDAEFTADNRRRMHARNADARRCARAIVALVACIGAACALGTVVTWGA